MGGFVAEAQRAVTQAVTLPVGYELIWGGQFEHLQEAARRLAMVVPVTLLLILGMLSVIFGAMRPAVENAFIESFNGGLRDECLNAHQFTSMAEAQQIIEAWRLDYNQRRPHSSLGHLTPNEFVLYRQVIRVVEEVVCSG